MIGWALTFLIVALLAAVFGFGGVAAASTGLAVAVFYVAIALFLISLVWGMVSSRGSAA